MVLVQYLFHVPAAWEPSHLEKYFCMILGILVRTVETASQVGIRRLDKTEVVR